jgi:XTP/dITP diphosphohydrolase
MEQLLIATRNAHKTREFAEILGDRFEISDLLTVTELAEIEETGKSFEENAILKAVGTSCYFPELLVLADDSGLEVDALQGAPGIYSARYAGSGATDSANIKKLMEELDRSGSGAATLALARFRCCLALARSGQVIRTFEGVVEGVIVNAPRGCSGFGYDPIFRPNGFDQTFAELSAEEKNAISHRARAIRSLRESLR